MSPNNYLDILKNYLPNYSRITSIILYGSRKRDLDFAVLYEEGSLSKKEFIYKDGLDIAMHPAREFVQRALIYDIEILEPLLSGEILFGNNLEKLKKEIISSEPKQNAVEYAIRKSYELFACSEYYIAQHDYTIKQNLLRSKIPVKELKNIFFSDYPEIPTKILVQALNCLTFSSSHQNAAKEYSTKKQIISYKEILAKDPTLRKIYEYMKDVENNRILPSRKKVAELHKSMEQEIEQSNIEALVSAA